MICKKCGNTLKEGAKFCNACGAPVQAQPAPIPSTAPVNREDTGYTIPLVREAAPVQNAAPVYKKPFPVKMLLLAVAAGMIQKAEKYRFLSLSQQGNTASVATQKLI